MLVKLRLARWGNRNSPFYGVVAAPVKRARDGKHLERLGTYNPVPTPITNSTTPQKHLQLNIERCKYWLGVGALPTSRVAWLFAKVFQELGKLIN